MEIPDAPETFLTFESRNGALVCKEFTALRPLGGHNSSHSGGGHGWRDYDGHDHKSGVCGALGHYNTAFDRNDNYNHYSTDFTTTASGPAFLVEFRGRRAQLTVLRRARGAAILTATYALIADL